MLRGDHSTYVNVKPTDPTLQKLSESMQRTGGSKVGSVKQDPNQPEVLVDDEEDSESMPPPKSVQTTQQILEIYSTYSLRFQNRLVEDVGLPRHNTAADLEQQVKRVIKLDDLSKLILVRSGADEMTRESLLSDPTRTIEDLDIDKSELELRALNVTFKLSLPDGNVVVMDFDRDDNLSKLVDAVLAMDLPDSEKLMLQMDGEQVMLKGTFHEAGIITGSYLDLRSAEEEGICLTVKWDGGSVDITMSAEGEVWNLLRKVEEAGGGNAQRMCLLDEDDNEIDDEGTLREWGIVEGSVLTVKMS